MVVLGLYEEIEPAATALRGLREKAGAKPDDLMVLSSTPFPEGVLDVERPKSRLPAMTVGCAVLGIVLGLLLAGGSAALYVLRTGGKPIESGPPIGIITYEVMMLVGLTGAFLAALYEMRLPKWQANVYDRRIAAGLIGIAVNCETRAQEGVAHEILNAAGAVDIRQDARRLE